MHVYLCRKYQRINNNKKLLELIIDYSKVARYKINIQKSILFLYAGNKQLEFEVKKNNNKKIKQHCLHKHQQNFFLKKILRY